MKTQIDAYEMLMSALRAEERMLYGADAPPTVDDLISRLSSIRKPADVCVFYPDGLSPSGMFVPARRPSHACVEDADGDDDAPTVASFLRSMKDARAAGDIFGYQTLLRDSVFGTERICGIYVDEEDAARILLQTDEG